MAKQPTRRPRDQRLEIDKRRRRHRVDEMLTHGLRSATAMAAALNVDVNTIVRDIKHIREQWLHDDRESAQSRAATRVRQIEAVMAAAWSSYQRSRKDEEEIVTSERICDNPDCLHGIVKNPDGKNVECPRCHGNYVVMITNRKIRGEPGDPAFLNVIKGCITECARIEGLYPQTMSTLKRTAEREMLPDGTIVERLEEIYQEASDDAIVRAMAALDEVKQESRAVIAERAKNQTKRIIDVGPSGTEGSTN